MLIAAIFQKLVLLYLNIALGFVSSKKLKVTTNDIAKLIFYVITPFVFVQGLLKIKIDPVTISLPIFFFFMSTIICWIFYYLSGFIWKNSVKNIVALSAGTGNTGFIGLPILITITNNNDYMVGTYITTMLGMTFYENTVGYFIAARGDHTAKETLLRILKMPILYAFILGCFLNLSGVDYYRLPQPAKDFFQYMQGSYFTLGMLLIGIAIGQAEKIEVDKKFIGIIFLAKFVAWPIFMKLFVIVDKYLLHWYNTDIHYLLMLLSIVPIATNIVTISTLLKIYPEKSASAVLLSAIFAVFYLSFMIGYVI